MRAKTIERICYAVAGFSLVVPIALSLFGITGFRGDLTKLTPVLAVALCGLAFICAVFVGREKRKIEAVPDERRRIERERALTKKMAFLVIALVATLPIGYFIGQRI